MKNNNKKTVTKREVAISFFLFMIINDTDDVYDNADVAFKKNGTFVRCLNHPVSRVYKVIYPTLGKS